MEFSFRDYQKASMRTMPKMVEGKYEFYYSNESVTNYCMGLAGETGEFIDLIKKALFHGHPLDDEKAMKELGDVLHYVSGLCTMLGFSLEKVATMNIDKLNQRYPQGFSSEASQARVDVDHNKKAVSDGLKMMKEKNTSHEVEKIKNLLDQLTPEGRALVLKRWGVE